MQQVSREQLRSFGLFCALFGVASAIVTYSLNWRPAEASFSDQRVVASSVETPPAEQVGLRTALLTPSEPADAPRSVKPAKRRTAL